MATGLPPRLFLERLRLLLNKGLTAKVEETLRNSESLNNTEADGKTALHHTALEGDVELTQLLLDAGMNPDASDAFGFTPLHRAAAQGHRDVIRLLISRGCDVNRQDLGHGFCALHEAAWHGYSDTLDILIRANANVHLVNKSGFTALHLAAQNGHNQSARVLLMAGANADAKNTHGDTPLHTAARYGHAGVTRILISARARVSELNENGDTPLHIAAALKRRKIAQLLVDAHIDCNVRNHQGDSALDIAVRKGHSEIVAVLQAPVDPAVVSGPSAGSQLQQAASSNLYAPRDVPFAQDTANGGSNGIELLEDVDDPRMDTRKAGTIRDKEKNKEKRGGLAIFKRNKKDTRKREHDTSRERKPAPRRDATDDQPAPARPAASGPSPAESATQQQPGLQQPSTQQPGQHTTQQPGHQQPGHQQPGLQQPGNQQPGPQQPVPGWFHHPIYGPTVLYHTPNGFPAAPPFYVPPQYGYVAPHPAMYAYYAGATERGFPDYHGPFDRPAPSRAYAQPQFNDAHNRHHGFNQPPLAAPAGTGLGAYAPPFADPAPRTSQQNVQAPGSRHELRTMQGEAVPAAGGRLYRSRSDESLSMSDAKAKANEERARHMALRELGAINQYYRYANRQSNANLNAPEPVVGRRGAPAEQFAPTARDPLLRPAARVPPASQPVPTRSPRTARKQHTRQRVPADADDDSDDDVHEPRDDASSISIESRTAARNPQQPRHAAPADPEATRSVPAATLQASTYIPMEPYRHPEYALRPTTSQAHTVNVNIQPPHTELQFSAMPSKSAFTTRTANALRAAPDPNFNQNSTVRNAVNSNGVTFAPPRGLDPNATASAAAVPQQPPPTQSSYLLDSRPSMTLSVAQTGALRPPAHQPNSAALGAIQEQDSTYMPPHGTNQPAILNKPRVNAVNNMSVNASLNPPNGVTFAPPPAANAPPNNNRNGMLNASAYTTVPSGYAKFNGGPPTMAPIQIETGPQRDAPGATRQLVSKPPNQVPSAGSRSDNSNPDSGYASKTQSRLFPAPAVQPTVAASFQPQPVSAFQPAPAAAGRPLNAAQPTRFGNPVQFNQNTGPQRNAMGPGGTVSATAGVQHPGAAFGAAQWQPPLLNRPMTLRPNGPQPQYHQQSNAYATPPKPVQQNRVGPPPPPQRPQWPAGNNTNPNSERQPQGPAWYVQQRQQTAMTMQPQRVAPPPSWLAASNDPNTVNSMSTEV